MGREMGNRCSRPLLPRSSAGTRYCSMPANAGPLNCEFIVGDLTNLDPELFPDDTVDLVHMRCIYRHIIYSRKDWSMQEFSNRNGQVF